MPTAQFPIIGSYDKQRFLQFSPEDCANWTMTPAPSGKKEMCLYPTMGRKHIRYLDVNRLIFSEEPRGIFRSIDYWYVVVADRIIRIDPNYAEVDITASTQLTTFSGDIFSSYLVAGQSNVSINESLTYVGFVDGENTYFYREDTNTFDIVDDPLKPPKPTYIETFGNRFVVSTENSSQFQLTTINLNGSSFNKSTCFTIAGNAVFAQEAGIIKQFAVLNNTLYIFTDFTIGIWSDNPSTFSSNSLDSPVTFPWKKSSSYNWDFGIFDPLSLDVDFNMMVWLAQNKNGLVQVMYTRGDDPKRLSTKAIDVLFQRNALTGGDSPFLSGKADGYLYQYENVIFYRLSAGNFQDFGILDQTDSANSIEYNFETQKWTRCIELNGERNRNQKHVFFNGSPGDATSSGRHFVVVSGDNTVYEMSGQFYTNEITNPDEPNPQSPNAYLIQPFRYERTTRIISQDDYSEFETTYVQIDFVFGESIETQYSPPSDITYTDLFKPHIELYFSDDGGISFNTADVRQFSQLGVYSWRMRWYQLGCSRNRVYKLVCVSNSPIVILGGIMEVNRTSGGAN